MDNVIKYILILFLIVSPCLSQEELDDIDIDEIEIINVSEVHPIVFGKNLENAANTLNRGAEHVLWMSGIMKFLDDDSLLNITKLNNYTSLFTA